MPSITFELETVTPLFLAGANQTEAELRPPAFRGALRYWFRALIGGYYWDDLTQLRKIESSILGATDDDYGSSKITIRLSRYSNNESQSVDFENKLGLKYLWFSMTNRHAIGVEEPVSFSLTFSTRPNPKLISQQQNYLLLIANCFWLAVNLGGFGSRERRGAGSLRVKQCTYQGFDKDIESKIPRFDIKFRSNDIAKFFKTQIKKISINSKNLLSEITSENLTTFHHPNVLPEYDIYKPSYSHLYWVANKEKSWEELLDKIGNQYSLFRRQYSRTERIIFGLPLTKVDLKTCRPSPLRIKVIKSVHDYYTFFSYSPAKFPESYSINNSSQFHIIDDFINSFESIERIF